MGGRGVIDGWYQSAVLDLPASDEQDVILEDLVPGGTYRYRVTAGGEALGEEVVFRTPTGAPDAVLEFDVCGDTGTGFPSALSLFARIEADAPPKAPEPEKAEADKDKAANG